MLKIRTGYSFRAAAGRLEDVMARLKEIGATAAPITDRASTFGFYRWSKLAEKNGLKPVFGVELAVTPSINAKKPAVDYWTFIAKDDIASVNRLVELATTQFRYTPLLTYEQAMSAEGVFKITGHRPLLDWSQSRSDVFIPLGPSTPKAIVRRAQEAGFLFAATSDNRYCRREDRGFYEVLCGRNAETQSYDQHIQSEEEWRASIARAGLSEEEVKSALSVSRRLLEDCNATMRKAKLPSPPRPATLREMCEQGAAKLGCNLDDPEYSARLDKELGMIEAKEYEDYFYIVADICQWARARMIVGPARGSSCGSLVCYLLGITTIDPIPHGLIFERFIDINRNDMPDIDIDFSDQQRYMVFDYITEKYGRENVARLGTVSTFQPRAALSECGAALRVPKWLCDGVADSIIERSSGDSRALLKLDDTLREMPAGRELLEKHPEMVVAARFEGHPRHYSQHAAGVVISNRPITDFVAIDHRSGATMCDKKDAEDGYNLLKIDALGLTQLSVFEDALEMAGLPKEALETLPLDDPRAFEVLQKRQWSGIFQFNGMALQSLASLAAPTCFEDIVAITALARPGPMASGGALEWANRKNGAPIRYPHPIFEPYLADTKGVVMFQEQVMEIGRGIGDLTWEDVTALRKAMSKSLGKEYFDQFGDRWKEGARKKGIDDDKALDVIWDDLCAYGSWAFNKSHSVAYGLISYWCCWFKANYPFEFAAATLSHETDADKQMLMLKEIVAEGYDYIPVDPEYSGRKWAVGERDGKKVLVGPLSMVKGIGPKIVEEIIGCRARGERITGRAAKLLANPKTPIDSLNPLTDRLRVILPDPAERNIYSPITKIGTVREDGRNSKEEIVIIGTLAMIRPRDENELVLIAKRGHEIKDGTPTTFLNLRVQDDTGIILGKINRFKYADIGKAIVDRGRLGKAIYAIKGYLTPNTGRFLFIDMVRYIGDMDPDFKEIQEADETKRETVTESSG